MVSRTRVRISLLSLAPVLSFTGLMALSQTPPPPQAPKKPSPFPLSLFQNATADDFVDEAACVQCHGEPHASFERSGHKPYMFDPKAPFDKKGCQGCHGPGGPHIANLEEPEKIRQFILSFTKSKPIESSMGCLRCHNDTMTMAHWRRSGHGRAEVSCNSCHGIHRGTPEEERRASELAATKKKRKVPFFVAAAEPRKLLKTDEATLCGECHAKEAGEFRHNFHHPIPEGRMVCSDCHEIHPRRASEKQHAAQTGIRSGDQRLIGSWKQGSEVCKSCHAEAAGPIIFEHYPVAGHTGDGCMDCHRPHGSHNPKMLRTFSRGLCNQCHTDKASNHFPGRTCWQAGCHAAPHGSNRDRFLFRR